MLAKSIISDQNFFDEASERTSSKQKSGRAPGVVLKTKGFYFAGKKHGHGSGMFKLKSF